MDIMKDIKEEIKGNSIYLNTFNETKTAIFIIDMINGFVYDGALASDNVAKMVGDITELNSNTKGYSKVFFIDNHTDLSEEFKSFPAHCLKDTEETKLITELDNEISHGEKSLIVYKNSTNGFFSSQFQIWLKQNENIIDNYIITGCVTDICVMQFALSLKAYFNERNMKRRLIVPINLVQTYDLGNHDSEKMNLFALYNMFINGIETVEKIIY